MRALIIDDEVMPAKDLAFLIDRYCFEVDSTEVCTSAAKAIELVKEKQFDLIFLDIEMPEMTGFDFVEYVSLSNSTKFIITSAYEQYAVKAFDINATHYLVKPVVEKDLVKAVRKVALELKKHAALERKKDKVISIFNDNENHVVKEEEIIRLEADGNYTLFHLMDGRSLLSSKNLRHYEELLSGELFFRSHRSHIINLKKIRTFSRGKAGLIVLANGNTVPLSKAKYEDLEKRLGL